MTETPSSPAPAGEHHEHQPVLHTPYDEPDRHWKLEHHQTTGEVVPGRRPAEQPLPMGAPHAEQLKLLATRPAGSSVLGIIDTLRAEVRDWRDRHWPGATENTRQLLEYWARPPGEGPLYSPFYAQREAVETVVYLSEVGNGGHDVVKRLKALGQEWSRSLTRLAIRMATGTGKTNVMAMLIAWYAVNRRAEHRHHSLGLARNVGRIVVIAPGRTIARQLRVLDPRRTDNLYDQHRLLPLGLRRRLSQVRVTVLNFEKLQPRGNAALGGLETPGKRSETLAWARVDESESTETYEEMWTRLLGRPTSRHGDRVVVLNDEAHHCWERADDAKTTRRAGTNQGVWMQAIHELDNHRHFRVDQIVDLTATPIFIDPRNTHRPAGVKIKTEEPLVPWIVSEFALMEAMEAGLVTIPMPPRRTDQADRRVLENLYEDNNGRDLDSTESRLKVRNALHLLYGDYENTFAAWEAQAELDSSVGHPVLIIIANSKKNARAFMDMLGGRLRPGSKDVYDPPEGGFSLLSNVPRQGASEAECLERPARTILVYSKGAGAAEKLEGDRFDQGAIGVREVKDSLQLEEILATVAVPGAPGGHVRCVVSVGMLTEGWDCRRVTHILGYRKFGSQLLCEQTMGRALRRHDYENRIEAKRQDTGEVTERFQATYATVLGVPFERYGIQGSGEGGEPEPPKPQTDVHVVEDHRVPFRIDVPDFKDYAVVHETPEIRLSPDRVTAWTLTPKSGGIEVRWAQVRGPIGRDRILVNRQPGPSDEPVWQLAAAVARILSQRWSDEDSATRYRSARLFSHSLAVVRQWLADERVNIPVGEHRVLLDPNVQDEARDQIVYAIETPGGDVVTRVGVPADPHRPRRCAGAWRPFKTTLTKIVPLQRSELNVAVCHSNLEMVIAEVLDGHPDIDAVVRNHGPERFEIPYKTEGKWAKFVPDFFARAKPVGASSGAAAAEVVPHLIVEGKGPQDSKASEKARWTRDWWAQCADQAAAADGAPEHRWAYVQAGPGSNIAALIERGVEEAVGR